MDLFGEKSACCFSGHREITEPAEEIKASVSEHVETLIGEGVRTFYAGGAIGFDMLAEEVVLEKKKIFPDVKLILVFPCKTQTRGWNDEEAERYELIKKAADEVIYTSDRYTKWCMHIRNRYMVDNSDRIICYLRKKEGGTAYTVRYAAKKNLSLYKV